MQHLIDKLAIYLKSTWQTLLANREQTIWGTFCFLFLHLKELSSKAFRKFFLCQKPSAEEIS